jgi:integration host factor subunit beta
VNALVESYGDKPEFTFNKDMARDVLGAFIQQIIMIEKGGTRIEIRKLGAFYPSFIKGQVRRNPKTGDAVQTQDKIVVRFKTSSLLQDKLNQAERVPQSA